MLIRVSAALVVCGFVSLSGCGKDEGAKKKAEPAPAAAPEEKAPPAATEPPFDEFDVAALRDDLQGAWLVDVADAGRSAWVIDGGNITVQYGKEQLTGTVEVTSPCTMRVTLERKGKKLVNDYNFAFSGDALHVGSGNVGLRADDLVLGCFGGVWYSYRAPDCTKWERDGDTWKSSTSLCKIDEAGGQTSFRVTNEDGETIGIWGSADDLMDGELRKHASKKGASLEGVVKAIDALEKAEAKAKKKKGK